MIYPHSSPAFEERVSPIPFERKEAVLKTRSDQAKLVYPIEREGCSFFYTLSKNLILKIDIFAQEKRFINPSQKPQKKPFFSDRKNAEFREARRPEQFYLKILISPI
jgi:hypothetical protein